MVNVGDRIKIRYQGVISDILIVDNIDGDKVWLIREETHNSCGAFKLDELDIVEIIDENV